MLHETTRNDDFLHNTALGIWMLQLFETMLQPCCNAVLQIVRCDITFKPDVLLSLDIKVPIISVKTTFPSLDKLYTFFKPIFHLPMAHLSHPHPSLFYSS